MLYYTILYYIIVYRNILYYIILLFYTILYYTILYYTIRHDTIRYNIVQYSTLLYSTPLHSTPRYSTLLYSTPLYSTRLHSILLYSTLLYSSLLYYNMLYYTILYYIILYDSLAPRQRSAGTRWSTAPSTRQAATASGSLEAEAVRACLRSEATRRDVPRSGFRFSAYLFLSPSFSLYIYLSLSIYIYIYTHMFACFPPQVWLTGGASCPASSCLGEPLHPQPVGELRRSTACRTETTETLATQPLEPRGGGDTLV